MKFTKKDIKQIKSKGIDVEEVNKQLETLKKGLPNINLKEAANINNGILELDEEKRSKYISFFESKRNEISILKFVPASGAATRMFKFLFQFLKEYDPKNETINSYVNRRKATKVLLFIVGIEKQPFYALVIERIKVYYSNYDVLSNDEKTLAFIKTLLDEDKLNFGALPKGLFPFHKYKDHIATAFEEHLFEAALYASSKGIANLHFTISEKHKKTFDKEFKRIQNIVEKKTGNTFNISFSNQKESTDTISVSLNNELFREDDGQLHFRPSGHGALLNNLNEFNADVIFIKNIDNVVVYEYEDEVAEYKKMLAGVLLEVQEQAFNFVRHLKKDRLSEEEIHFVAQFLRSRLNIVISSEFEKYSNDYKIEYLLNKLNRPIRVCGMVVNEGEPGGGPFWVKDESGNISLQIVESAQIDKESKHQKSILKNATHFNPVDLVCGMKNYKGELFDLQKFVDPKAAFITMKTKAGKELKALELPGLWNGSMANWNTVFVEVPLVTFNPVKTVNDLLKPTHQI